METSNSTLVDKQPQRILLGQLSAKGDCLYTTAIARQIKKDYPGCYLIWGIGSMCSSLLQGNPDVDEVWQFPMENHGEMESAWHAFETEVAERYHRGEFDKVFLTQISPNNFQNFDGTVRLSIFRAYPHPITVPVAPVVNLMPEEEDRVRQFATQYHLLERSNIVLFECSSKSGQSFVTPDYALEVAKFLIEKLPDTSVILASEISAHCENERIVSSSLLPFRDHAELSKYCNLLVGCSSGISWLCTSNWAKPLPMIQLLSASTSVYASMIHDFEYWGKSTDHIIEITDCSSEYLADCIHFTLTKGIEEARLCYYQPLELDFTHYLSLIRSLLLEQGEYGRLSQSLLNTISRYGWHFQLQAFMLEEFLPVLKKHNQHHWLETYNSRQVKKELEHKESQLIELRQELELSHQQIIAMESSKFWQLRSFWFQIKKIIGLHAN